MTLVLVEGSAGTGKTTTATALASDLGCGPADVVLEGSRPHPIIEHDANQSIAEFVAALRLRWSALGKALQTRDSAYVIVEAATFQYAVNWLLCRNASQDRVLGCLADLAKTMAPALPVLVYLHQEPPLVHFWRTVSERSSEWFDTSVGSLAGTEFGVSRGGPLDALISEFVSTQRRITDQAFESWPFQKLRVDVSGRAWRDYEREIASFLSAAA